MKKLLVCFAVAALLTGCSSSKKIVYMQDVPLDSAVAVPAPSVITLRPGDQLSIIVSCREPALASMFNPTRNNNSNNGTSTIGGTSTGSRIGVSGESSGTNTTMPYTINSQGDIDFPVLGELHVAGLNREEVADLIKKRIRQGGYIEDPIVTVSFYNMHYTVLGEVAHAGQFTITDDKVTLLDAIAKAGDLTIYGVRDAVYVTRTADGKRTTTKVDLTGTDFYNSPVYYIMPDDVIYVEPNGVRIGQSSINENSFKSVSMWMSIASFLMSLTVLIAK